MSPPARRPSRCCWSSCGRSTRTCSAGRWLRSAKHAAERLSVFVLVGSALVQLVTGFLNTLHWYLWPWDFASVHRFLAYVVIGSILLHVA